MVNEGAEVAVAERRVAEMNAAELRAALDKLEAD